MQIPRHLAIIMDGNGRWAERRSLPRIAGHSRGVETVRSVIEECRQQGVKYLTLYAFSSENWGRPQPEVDALMGLLGRYLGSELPRMLSEGVRFKVIGDISRLPDDVVSILGEAVRKTTTNSGLVLTLALSYGSRDEILRAVRTLAQSVLDGGTEVSGIGEKEFSMALDTYDLPDPDLLIRTSGEMRVSNFLLWQLAYTELYFTDTLWPDFAVSELRMALEEYGRRQRRYGLTANQLDSSAQSQEEDSH